MAISVSAILIARLANLTMSDALDTDWRLWERFSITKSIKILLILLISRPSCAPGALFGENLRGLALNFQKFWSYAVSLLEFLAGLSISCRVEGALLTHSLRCVGGFLALYWFCLLKFAALSPLATECHYVYV